MSEPKDPYAWQEQVDRRYAMALEEQRIREATAERLPHGDYQVGDILPSIFRPGREVGSLSTELYVIHDIEQHQDAQQDRIELVTRDHQGSMKSLYATNRQELDNFFLGERHIVTRRLSSILIQLQDVPVNIHDVARMRKDSSFYPEWARRLDAARERLQEGIYQFYFTDEPNHQELADVLVDTANLIAEFEHINLGGDIQQVDFSLVEAGADPRTQNREVLRQMFQNTIHEYGEYMDNAAQDRFGAISQTIQALAREERAQRILN